VLDLTSSGYLIAGISVGLTLMSSLVRHATLDKEKLKEQKERLKHHQEQAKQAHKRKDLKAAQDHQSKMLEVSMEQMHAGMKPMLFTIIPFMIVLGWMNTNFGDIGALHNATISAALPAGDYKSLNGGPDSRVEGSTVSWNFTKMASLQAGHVNLSLEQGGQPPGAPALSVEYTTHNGSKFAIAGGEAASSLKLNMSGPFVEGNKAVYSIGYANTDPYRVATLFGYELGWFGWYFVCSIISGIILNKLLGNT
jgi:uncharacterized membrane protein (DUF106 family)